MTRRIFLLAGGAQVRREEKDDPGGSTEKELMQALNEARIRERLAALEWHDRAADVARSHSIAMARGGFFSHTDPERGNMAARLKAARVQWSAAAENLFQQRGCKDLIACAIEGWRNSEGHARNMFNGIYTHAGVGINADRRGTMFYTVVFLKPAKEARR